MGRGASWNGGFAGIPTRPSSTDTLTAVLWRGVAPMPGRPRALLRVTPSEWAAGEGACGSGPFVGLFPKRAGHFPSCSEFGITVR